MAAYALQATAAATSGSDPTAPAGQELPAPNPPESLSKTVSGTTAAFTWTHATNANRCQHSFYRYSFHNNTDDSADYKRISDAQAISRAPGVGKRTAERIILELRGKLEEEFGGAFVPSAGGGAVSPVAPGGDPALQWLLALGYSMIEARQALSVEREEGLATDERVKRALQRMGGG